MPNDTVVVITFKEQFTVFLPWSSPSSHHSFLPSHLSALFSPLSLPAIIRNHTPMSHIQTYLNQIHGRAQYFKEATSYNEVPAAPCLRLHSSANFQASYFTSPTSYSLVYCRVKTCTVTSNMRTIVNSPFPNNQPSLRVRSAERCELIMTSPCRCRSLPSSSWSGITISNIGIF